MTPDEQKEANQFGEFITRGNVTEQGILRFFMNLHEFKKDGGNGGKEVFEAKQEFAKEMLKGENGDCCTIIEFTSKRKRASIVVKTQVNGTEMARVYTKGAPDMLFPMLEGVLDSDMNVHALNEATEYDGENCDQIGKLNKVVVKFAKQAYRTILLCKKDITMDEYNQIKADHNNFATNDDKECLEVGGLMALGIFALQDPLRGDIKDSIAKVRVAGIQVIMATGDNIDTAIAISKNANIIEDKHIAASPQFAAMTGENFRNHVGELKKIPDPEGKKDKDGEIKMVDSVGNLNKFREVKEHLRVMARCSPTDKLLLSTGLQ